MEAGGDLEEGLSRIEQCILTQLKVTDGEAGRVAESLHENGRVNGLMEKQDRKMMGIERKASDQPNI